MNVQVYIPDWPGEKQHAAELHRQLNSYYPSTVLADPDDYFNAKWAKARNGFTGDVLLWVMADVTLPQEFFRMSEEIERIMDKGDVGIYAPNVRWTSYIYDKHYLPVYETFPDENIYEVPNTDSLLIAIHGDVVRAMPHIDPAISFMWGMDITAIATARLQHKKIVRDYRFKAMHPNSTGYDIEAAGRGMAPLFKTFSPRLRAEIAKVEAEVYYKRVEV